MCNRKLIIFFGWSKVVILFFKPIICPKLEISYNKYPFKAKIAGTKSNSSNNSSNIVLQRQPFKDVLQNRSSEKLGNMHRKTPVLEYLFNKVAGLKIFKKLLRTAFFIEQLWWMLLVLVSLFRSEHFLKTHLGLLFPIYLENVPLKTY